MNAPATKAGRQARIAELIERRGIAAMREAISNTAELGAVTGGPRIVDDRVRSEMRAILASIRSGEFASLLSDEAANGYPRLRAARQAAAIQKVERARQKLRDLTGD